MIDKDKAQKFGYKEVTPYKELLHAIGLLHTARKVDTGYALSAIKKILNQKFDSYSINIVYDSTRGKKEVVVAKSYKEGRDGLTARLKKSLPKASVEFNSDIGATVIELSSEHNGLFKLKNNITFSSLASHFRIIIIFDVTRNTYQMFMKLSKNTSKQ